MIFARKFVAYDEFDLVPVAFCQSCTNFGISDAISRELRLDLPESASKCIIISQNSLPSPMVLCVGIDNGNVSAATPDCRRRDGPQFVPISSDCFTVRRICLREYLLDAQSNARPHCILTITAMDDDIETSLQCHVDQVSTNPLHRGGGNGVGVCL